MNILKKKKSSNGVNIKILVFSILLAAMIFWTVGSSVQAAVSIRDLKAEEIQRIKNLRDQNREEIRIRTQNLKENIQAKREEARTRLEVYREKLKEKLAQFRDERKKKIVERIDQQLEKLNARLADHFVDVLDRLERILSNIVSRTDKAETAGYDVSAARTAITQAQSAISAARQVVKDQANKIYEVTLTTEEKLRVDVGAARQALHQDLVATRQKVKDARDAVHQAAAALGKIVGVDLIKTETTVSPSVSP